MKSLKLLLRWVALLVFIALSLIYLNSTAYSLWAAGEPATDMPNAWLNQAFFHFGYSIALLIFGIVIFQALKNGFEFIKTKLFLFCIITFVIALCYPQIRAHLLIDACLDSGGSWSKMDFECKK